MDRRTLDRLLPMIYGLLVVVAALLVTKALIPVVVIGAILLGIYYAVLRSRLPAGAGGRQRNRNRAR